MSLAEQIKPGDWRSVRSAIAKLDTKLGPASTPTFAGLTLSDPLTVPYGGTGLATLTDHGILLGSGTGAITPLAEATDGQIPIGDTDGDPILATITGTANRITVSNSAGGITLTAPQDLHTGASPTFQEMLITTSLHALYLDIKDASTEYYLTLFSDSTPNLSTDRDLGFDVTNANRLITLTGDPTLANWFDQSVKQAASPTFVGGTFSAVVTGVIPTAGTHFATKEYVDLAIGASEDFFLSDNDDAVIADYHILYETDTGEASSTLVTDPMPENDDQLMFSYITASGVPGVTSLRAGVYILHTHMSRGTGDKPTTFYWTLSKYTTGDVETVLLTSEESSEIPNSIISFRTHATLASDATIDATDRLVLKLYANVGAAGGNSEVTIHMEGTHDCHLTNLLPSDIWQNQGDVLDDLNTLGIVGADSEFLVGTGAGALTWESGATARTSIGLGTGNSPTFAEIITPTINSNTAQDLKLWEDLEIADNADGRSLYIYRNADTEGTDYFRLYVDQYTQGVLESSSNIFATAALAVWFKSYGSWLRFTADQNVFFDLGDNAGGYKVIIRDSDVATVATIDSDGNAVFNGTLGVTGVATLGDGSLLATSAAPTTDAMIANKLYVNNAIAFSAYTTEDSESNTILKAHTYQAATAGFIVARVQLTTAGHTLIGYVETSAQYDIDGDPIAGGTVAGSQEADAINSHQSICFPVAKNEYFEITCDTANPDIKWKSVGALSKPVDKD